MSFGDHATIITGGSGNSVGGPPSPPGWSRTGKIVVGVATVVSAILAAVTLWVTWPEPTTGRGNAPAQATTPTSRPAAAPPADQPAATRPAIYDGVLTLNRYAGFDLDEGRATKRNNKDADTDLYLGDYLAILAGDVYLDSFGGSESGAHDRCRAVRQSGGTPLPQAIGTGNTQYCFTSSAGRPGWLRVVRLQSADSVLVEAVIWAG
jgi:hypothetical protein